MMTIHLQVSYAPMSGKFTIEHTTHQLIDS